MRGRCSRVGGIGIAGGCWCCGEGRLRLVEDCAETVGGHRGGRWLCLRGAYTGRCDLEGRVSTAAGAAGGACGGVPWEGSGWRGRGAG
jgi:hypothetical protein